MQMAVYRQQLYFTRSLRILLSAIVCTTIRLDPMLLYGLVDYLRLSLTRSFPASARPRLQSKSSVTANSGCRDERRCAYREHH